MGNVYLLCCSCGCTVAVVVVVVVAVVLFDTVDTIADGVTTVGGNEFILYHSEEKIWY